MSTKTDSFPLGQVVATANALLAIPILDVHRALDRHASRDWGELCGEDLRANALALEEGGRLLSIYTTAGGTRFWIVTERDRSVTTLLLPEGAP
ncbi:hypothetical protein BH11ARM2_BH11ARM2_28830 [soil metagenome]